MPNEIRTAMKLHSLLYPTRPKRNGQAMVIKAGPKQWRLSSSIRTLLTIIFCQRTKTRSHIRAVWHLDEFVAENA
jgi:hypothetical protein